MNHICCTTSGAAFAGGAQLLVHGFEAGAGEVMLLGGLTQTIIPIYLKIQKIGREEAQAPPWEAMAGDASRRSG